MMGGNPTDWWSMMMMMDGTTAMHSQSSSSSSSSSSQNLYGSSNSLADNHNSTQDFPRSWSQLLLGGLGGESEKFGMMTSPSPLQHKKMENWEDLQTLQNNNNNNPSSSSSSLLRPPFAADNIKQEFPLQINLGRHHHMAAASSLSTHSNNVFNIPSSGTKVGDLDSCKNQHHYYSSECNSTSSGGPSKKPRVHHSSSQPSLKVRKEKLGDRITALHQIVSPFGKTDTASVLSEAIGYIRFLHSQIQALSTPYMGNNPSAGSMARHSHQQSLYVLGKDIRPDYTKKAIRLRLVRTYIVPEGRNTEVIKSQECLFHDCEGTYVHGSIPKQYVPQFTNVLQEGQVYAIKNFLVISNYYQYKTTEHRYMIKFNHETEVQRHRRKSFPNLIFRLKSFDDLISGVVSDKQIIDVIGRVVEFYSPKDKIIAGHPSKLVDFLIEDAKGNRIKCTLWDDHVEAVMPFFNAHVDGPLIILLQLCRAKRVDNEVRISSSYTATKVWFNHDCKEFTDFKASLKVDHTPLRSINSMSMLSYGNSVDNNSKTPVIVSTIIDLYGRAEEGHYFVPAKIVGLESGRHWYYTSCSAKGCFKKLDPNQGSLKCDKCFVSCPEITLRYRLIVRVVDKTSDAPLLLWDKECTELIGMSAFDLKSKYSQDDSEIPTELESLRNKAMVFKVSIKDEHLKNPAKPIPVLKITNDQELVSVYCPSLTDDHDELSKMIGEELQDEESDDSESGDEASSPAVQQSLKAIREDSSEKVEPGAIKRCLLDQFSSSQDVKRSKAFIIKQEKN